MSIYKNGWTRESMMKQIEEMNGFKRCYNDEKGYCSYRNDQGKACLVGAFIPDDLYSIKMEDTSTNPNFEKSLFITYPELIKYMPLNINYMHLLQKGHDYRRFNSENSKSDIEKFLDELEVIG